MVRKPMTVAGETSTCKMANTPTVTAISCRRARSAEAAMRHERKYTVISSATSAMKITSDCAAFVVTDEPQEGPIDED
jgi:lipoprotein